MQFEKLLFLIHFLRIGKDKKESEALCVKEFYTNKQKHAMKKIFLQGGTVAEWSLEMLQRENQIKKPKDPGAQKARAQNK